MQLDYRWFIFLIVSLKYALIEGKIFFVSDYGAHPDDNLDDTNEIQLAINQAIKDGPMNDIVFGDGIYTIASTILIANAINLTITGQGMDQTFLIGTSSSSIFSAHVCQGIKLTSFSIDYDPLPFTAGYIVNVNDNYLDVEVVSPHQTDIDRKVQGILRYDPVNMRPAFGNDTLEIYQKPPDDVNTTIVSPGVLRIPLSSPTLFRKGDPIVARYAFTEHAIYAQSITDITIQSIVIYASWSMGFVTVSAKQLNVINYHIIPRNGRWMSSNQDCMHFIDTREYVSISDSICQSMGDDGLNVHAVFFLVIRVIDPKTIVIEGINGTGPLDVGIGTNLEFSSNSQPFTVYGNGTISSLEYVSMYSRKITFTEPVTINLNDWVCVSNTPLLTIRNFTVSHNRARGVLLETRNIDIRQSVFNQTSGPAVLIQPSMYWHEGPEARNISLIDNIYINNNEGIAHEKGIIAIIPNPSQLVPVINDIRIESSTFYFGMYTQTLLQSDNGHNVFISGNSIVTNYSTPLVSICNSRNISAENNCHVNDQTKIDKYYTFDENNPCSMNLSSLIDLPPSAFNATCPPKSFIFIN